MLFDDDDDHDVSENMASEFTHDANGNAALL